MKILITGGAGYIGSTIASILEDSGHTPIILDDLSKGRREFVAGRIFYRADLADRGTLRRIVSDHPEIEVTVHCAALAVVEQSVAQPYDYFRTNVSKSLELFDCLLELDKPRVVFSSSASVYGDAQGMGFDEKSRLAPASPYARTKYVTELALADIAAATGLRAIILRYFNPIGADPGLRSGGYEDNPSHVLGRLLAVAEGDSEQFEITGTDFPTRDGTGMRDYVHVWDLAKAHVRAVERFDHVLQRTGTATTTINIGTGTGVTVLELVAAFERAIGREISTREAPRRSGDTPGGYAESHKASELMGWRSESTLEDSISSAIAWMRHRHLVLSER